MRRIAGGETVLVHLDNFARAETERMLFSTQAAAGGINRLGHNRTPTPVEHQPVIRMNRDTLCSFAVVDISEGATVTIPDSGDSQNGYMIVRKRPRPPDRCAAAQPTTDAAAGAG